MTETKGNLAAFLFHEGTNYRSYLYFGAREGKDPKGEPCTVFRLWAPNAREVRIVGSFCGWMDEGSIEMHRDEEDPSIFTGYGYGLKQYDTYKYRLVDTNGRTVYKSDPYGIHMETRPSTGTKIYPLDGYFWEDADWMKKRSRKDKIHTPMNIYELHLGSWKRHEDGSVMDYGEIADQIVAYVKDMGYTHIELMPLAEFPFDGSWGYQVLGYFAPTSRYGTPDGLKYLVDLCHRNNIGVLMDWVPAHFPKDECGLANFDGTPLYEYADPRKGDHKEWGTKVFDYGKGEVVSFLISSAMYWLDQYHVDGLRVDAVASMLYLNYARKDGEWVPNIHGGNENLEAAAFLRKLNEAVQKEHPGVIMAAEESTTYPGVTHPVSEGGLGFTFKWNMGWMNDVLRYVKIDPIYRQYHHQAITFSMVYAFSENFILPLSHDEVVHGKQSLLDKQQGSYEEKFASLRSMLGFMMGHPGKKLTFMGSEFGQFIEWDYNKELDWFLLEYPLHKAMQTYMKALNHFYLEHPSFYEEDDSWKGFQWISCDDAEHNTVAFRRIDSKGKEIVGIVNFAPVPWKQYRLDVEVEGTYEEIFSSEEERFGGSGVKIGAIKTEPASNDGQKPSLTVDLPPYSCIYFSVKKKPGRKKTS